MSNVHERPMPVAYYLYRVSIQKVPPYFEAKHIENLKKSRFSAEKPPKQHKLKGISKISQLGNC